MERVPLAPPQTTDSIALPDLAALDALLQREAMVRGPDVWISMHALLARRAARSALPGEARQLASILAPLVCKSPQQQARFPAIVAEWLGEAAPATEATLVSPGQSKASHARAALARFGRRGKILTATTLAILLGAGHIVYHRPPVDPPPRPPEPAVYGGHIDSDRSKDPKLRITDRVEPNPLPQAPPMTWRVREKWIGVALIGLPWIFFSSWVIWRYRARTVLRREGVDGDTLFDGLRFALRTDAPFSGSETVAPLQTMKRPWSEPGRRLHIPATVRATAREAGHFTSRFRQRTRRAEYLILVRYRHRDDQSARFAELLLKKLHDERLDVRGYRFRHDPRWLLPWEQNPHDSARPLNLAKLAERFPYSRVIVISDGDILFDPFTGTAREWIGDFHCWERRVWLSAGREGGATADLLQRHAFHVLPLTGGSLVSIADWLSGADAPTTHPATAAGHALPELLSKTADSWLDTVPPHGADLDELVRQLDDYLGADGMLLLRTLAVYPKPHWDLTYALDALLFAPAATDRRVAPASSRSPGRWLARWARRAAS